MNIILYILSFSFSFFFILLSYWKEDKFFNIIGSISLMIVATILIGSSIQITDYVPTMQIVTSNATGNYTSIAYSAKTYNYGVFYENLGIGVLFVVFTSLQYLYFVFSHKVAKESS